MGLQICICMSCSCLIIDCCKAHEHYHSNSPTAICTSDRVGTEALSFAKGRSSSMHVRVQNKLQHV